MNTVEALVNDHLGIARDTAQRWRRKVPLCISLDELYAAALEGVWNACRIHDPQKTMSLRTLCAQKASFAILDWLRVQDHLTRQHRSEEPTSLPPMSLSTGTCVEDDGTPRYLADCVGISDAAVWTRLDTADLVAWACRGLLPDEREAVTLYYLDNLTMCEIGLVIGVSESQISNIIKRSLAFLRGRLELLAEREERGSVNYQSETHEGD